MNPNFLNKTFESYSSLNFEEYMKEIGYNYIFRKIGNITRLRETIREKPNETYELLMAYSVKNHVTTFKLGEEVTRDLMDGRKSVTSVFTVNGNTLSELQYCPSMKNVKLQINRTFQQQEMKMELTANKISATRFYKLINLSCK